MQKKVSALLIQSIFLSQHVHLEASWNSRTLGLTLTELQSVLAIPQVICMHVKVSEIVLNKSTAQKSQEKPKRIFLTEP